MLIYSYLPGLILRHPSNFACSLGLAMKSCSQILCSHSGENSWEVEWGLRVVGFERGQHQSIHEKDGTLGFYFHITEIRLLRWSCDFGSCDGSWTRLTEVVLTLLLSRSSLFTNRLRKWLGSHFLNHPFLIGSHFLTHPFLISLSPVSLLCYLSSPPHVAIPRGEKSLKQPILLMCRGPGHCWGDLLAQLRKNSLGDTAKSKPAPWGPFILVISAWMTLCKEAGVHSGTWWPFLQRPSCLHCIDLKQAAQRNEEWYQDAKMWSYWEKTA